MRPGKEVIAVWTKRSENDAAKKLIHDSLKELFSMPAHFTLEYRTHAASESLTREDAESAGAAPTDS